METTKFLYRLKPVLVLVLAYGFAVTAAAQNYYPADVGNTWVLENADIEKRLTYSLEGPETFEGTEVITLKIEIEELSTGELVDTDKYFLTVGSEDIKLHGTFLEQDRLGTVTTNFPTPVTFFPLSLTLGDKWQISTDAAKLSLAPLIPGKSTTNLEVVAFEDIETPAGTFQNCAKVKLALTFSTVFLELKSTTYQWLAPDIGPVQYQNSEDLIFKLVSTNLPTEPEAPDTPEEDVVSEQPPEEETTPEPLPYDVTGDGVVNILDLTFVASHFGASNPEADVNDDGIVNILDLVLIAQNFSS